MNSNRTQANNKIPQGGLPIGKRVRRALDDEYNQILFVCLCVGLILMIIVLYKYTYGQVTQQTLHQVDKLRAADTRLAELRLKQLDTCQQQDSPYRHRLCDYYIASSYNTACTGQQHFGYVSDDMIAKALKNGARFIHLKIAADSTNRDTAKPVICTAIGQRITSMNTVPLREALVTIQQYAFTYERTLTTDSTDLAPVNYPLFIYLDLHTPYESVLDQIAADIRAILGRGQTCSNNKQQDTPGGQLLDAARYIDRPIGLAPVCDLLNQIIILASPGYENSQALTSLVVPLDNAHLARTTDYERIMTTDDTDMKMTGKIEAADRYKTIEKLATEIASGASITSSINGNTTGTGNKKLDKLLAGDEVLRHMFTLSIVFPVRRPEDEQITTSTNPDPIPIMRQGAQFICMHYQKADENLQQYLELFLHKYRSSFILKPSGMRLPPAADDLTQSLNAYRSTDPNAIIANNPSGFPGAVPLDAAMVRRDMVGKYWRFTSVAGLALQANSGQLQSSQVFSAGESGSAIGSVFQILEHPSSTTDTCLIMLATLDGDYAIAASASGGSQPQLQRLDKVSDDMAFYLEQAPDDINSRLAGTDNTTSGTAGIDGEQPRYKLFRMFSRRVPTYLSLDSATRQPVLAAMSTASNDNLGFDSMSGGGNFVLRDTAMELQEAVVRKRVRMWIQHPQLGLRYVAVFSGSQLGLTSNADKQAVFELRRITEDGLVAIVLPTSKPDGKLLVHESSSGQAKVVTYGEHNRDGRKWRFLILRQSGGRVYLDDENGDRLGAMNDGRLRWRTSWPLDSAVTEFYMKETAMEVVG